MSRAAVGSAFRDVRPPAPARRSPLPSPARRSRAADVTRTGFPAVAGSFADPGGPALARSTLSRVDYADAFLMRVPDVGRWPAEHWARLVLSEAPAAVRTRLVAGWTALGLKLSRSARSILGWTVRSSDADDVLLGADSRTGMPAQLLFERTDDAVLFCTFVTHDNALAR